MAPVILGMDVHCYGCAKKIRKAVRNMPGVEGVSTSFETGQVVVEGTADAAALKARLEAKLRKPITIVADGAEEESSGDDDAGAEYTPLSSQHYSPPAPPPAGPQMGSGYHTYGYGYGYGNDMPPPPQYAPPPPPSHYAPPPPPEGGYYYPYYGGSNPWAMQYDRQYMSNDAPTTFNDENPNACCIQ